MTAAVGYSHVPHLLVLDQVADVLLTKPVLIDRIFGIMNIIIIVHKNSIAPLAISPASMLTTSEV